MTRQEAIRYLQSSGMSEEQIRTVVEALADAYEGFPAQVTVKNCNHCTINIYPSQTKLVEVGGDE